MNKPTSKIPEEIVNYFGNLIALREVNEDNFLGLPEVFISSIIQFQPLIDIEVYLKSGEKLELTEVSSKKTPISQIKTFENEIVQLQEEIIVDDNDISYNINFQLKENYDQDKLKIVLSLSGAVLFSPQGVPYHWKEKKLINSRIINDRKVNLSWRDKLSLDMLSSREFNWFDISSIGDELIEKRKYFSTYNIKNRYTYWVDRLNRKSLINSEKQEINNKARNFVYGGEVELELEKGEEKSYIFGITVHENTKENPNNSEDKYKNLKDSKNKHWDDFISKTPVFYSEDKDLEDLYYKSWYVLFSNKIELNEPRLKYPFTSVNKYHYYNHFLWDSAFHAISWLWHNDQTQAESELKNFTLNQWRNGMIPYELFLFDVNGREWMESDFLSTAATQPPVLGISIMEIYKKFSNKSFLSFFYEPLLKYEEWFWKYRDLDKRGLSHCFHIWETGCDNSPKFDSIARNRLLDPSLEEVDFNIFLYIMRKNIMEIAKILGKEPPAYLQERIDLTKESMNNIMYDKDEQVYYDVLAGSGEKIKVKSFSCILPLITDIPDKTKKDILINSYLLSEEEFNTHCPVPSVSRSEPSFGSNDFWRGANWPQITWTFIYGLKDYDIDAASLILSKFLKNSAEDNMCNEYFDSVTGKGEDAGLPFQGWGTLYIDLILRHVVGLEPLAEGFSFAPLKTDYNNFGVKDLLINGIEVNIAKKDNAWEFLLNEKHKLTLLRAIPFNLKKGNNGFEIVFEESLNSKEVLVEGSDYKIEDNKLTIKS